MEESLEEEQRGGEERKVRMGRLMVMNLERLLGF